MKRIEDKILEQGGESLGTVTPGGLGGGGGKAHLPRRLFDDKASLQPGQGKRPGRPTDPSWTERHKVPMSHETFNLLVRGAKRESVGKRKVTPMQVAARLIERSLTEA